MFFGNFVQLEVCTSYDFIFKKMPCGTLLPVFWGGPRIERKQNIKIDDEVITTYFMSLCLRILF